MKLIVILLLLILNTSTILCQITRILTYEEAIEIALNQSYTIKSHLENKKAMQSSFMYHKAQFKPRIDFNVFTPNWNESVSQINRADSLPVFNSTGSIRFGGDMSFKYILPTGGNFALHSILYRENLKTVLASQSYNTLSTDQVFTNVGISFEQPVFTKNTLRENLKVAEYQYQQASNYYTRGQMDIVYDVTKGFYALYKATRLVEINQEKLKNSQEAYRIARLKLGAMRIAEAEALIAEVQLEQDKAKLSESKSNLESEQDIFKQLIGLNLDQNIEISENIQYDTFNIDLDLAIEEALKNRLELNDADLEIRLKSIELDRAKRERELRGSISANYDLTGLGTIKGASTGELIESSFNNFLVRPPTRGIMLSFSYPIYDWGRGSAKVQQAKANIANVQLEKEDVKTTIIKEVRDIVRTVEETRGRLIINERNQELASRSYNVSQLRFENGDITSQQLGQEQARLSDVQLAYLDAYITYKLAVADLKRKTMWNFIEGRSYIIEDKR